MPTDIPSATIIPFLPSNGLNERQVKHAPATDYHLSIEALRPEGAGVADEIKQHLHAERLLELLKTDFPDDWYVDADTGEGIFLAADEAMFREFFGLFGMEWNSKLPMEKLLAVWTEVHGRYGGMVSVFLKYPPLRKDASCGHAEQEQGYIEAVAFGWAYETRRLATELGLVAMMRWGQRRLEDGSDMVTITLR